MDNSELAAFLQGRLGLIQPPIALTFVTEQPQRVPRTDWVMPSACAFWRLAETSLFYASAEDHFNCPVGAVTMGFQLPAEKTEDLRAEVGMMCEIFYLREAEVEHIPKVTKLSDGIVYGPLEKFPMEPDAVIIWVNPVQAMVMSECCGLINWGTPSPGVVLGRPGCAAIPAAMAEEKLTQSFGCIGTRINTDIPGDRFLMVIPRKILESLPTDLYIIGEVHQQMRNYYLARAAKTPLVRKVPQND